MSLHAFIPPLIFTKLDFCWQIKRWTNCTYFSAKIDKNYALVKTNKYRIEVRGNVHILHSIRKSGKNRPCRQETWETFDAFDVWNVARIATMSDLDYRRKEYPLDYRGGERSRRERSPVSSRRPRSRSRDRHRRRDRSRSIETDRKTGSSKGRRHRSKSSGSSEVEERYGHALRILAVDFFQLSVLCM